MTVLVFILFVGIVLAISTYTSRKATGIGGFFVANNSIKWGVNGIAFAGSYLSVASFLGICGLIAFFGFDGFLYSIGFLAGWIIALFVIAEPMKRMGTFVFSDALDQRFKHRGIRLAAGISVLIVSLFYLVPQMVGAGVLIEPLLGISHFWGVIIVGSAVVLIVAVGGMTSTTYVQFFNGGLLLLFAAILTGLVLLRGVNVDQLMMEEGESALGSYQFKEVPAELQGDNLEFDLSSGQVIDRHALVDPYTAEETQVFYQISYLVPVVEEDGDYVVEIKGRRLQDDVSALESSNLEIEEHDGEPHLRIRDWWRLSTGEEGSLRLVETQFRAVRPDGQVILNGAPESPENRIRQVGGISQLPEKYGMGTGATGPLRLLGVMADPKTIIQQPKNTSFTTDSGDQVTIYYEQPVNGSIFMRPGLLFPLEAKIGEPASTTLLNRLNFISLMLALFLGTAALPHILIRYFTVPDPDSARKSTIIAIIGIGLFYIFTMYLGVGAINSGALNPETSNMSAPLLARSFGEVLFAMISGIAFTTVLATVSGLIMAASGAVAHDLMGSIRRKNYSDDLKVRVGRLVSIVVGVIGIILGIFFREMNVSFLVGWAFAVAASANLPSLLMMLFWKKTTAQGIISSILVGIFASVSLILLSPDMWARYGLNPANAPMPINQPGIVSIPLSFIVLVVVSLLTAKKVRQGEMDDESAQA
ncbi:MAG: cation acetate symporter [Brevefilum sp.]